MFGKNNHIISTVAAASDIYWTPVRILPQHPVRNLACGTWHAVALTGSDDTEWRKADDLSDISDVEGADVRNDEGDAALLWHRMADALVEAHAADISDTRITLAETCPWPELPTLIRALVQVAPDWSPVLHQALRLILKRDTLRQQLLATDHVTHIFEVQVCRCRCD